MVVGERVMICRLTLKPLNKRRFGGPDNVDSFGNVVVSAAGKRVPIRPRGARAAVIWPRDSVVAVDNKLPNGL